MINRTFLLFLALLFTTTTSASWQLDRGRSSISLMTIKNGSIAEAHHFGEYAGSVTDEGAASVTIELGSIETGIPIRNERMQAMLFMTDRFPTAQITTKVPVDELAALTAGESRTLDLAATLNLHGNQQDLGFVAKVVKAGEGTYVVTSESPILVRAGQWGLEAGVEALRAIAGLNSITPVVPVYFSLVFVESDGKP